MIHPDQLDSYAGVAPWATGKRVGLLFKPGSLCARLRQSGCFQDALAEITDCVELIRRNAERNSLAEAIAANVFDFLAQR